MGFPKLITMSDTHARILISLYSHCFITGEISCEIFHMAEHVVAVHILKDWRWCVDPNENIACLLDNRGRKDFVQLQDVDVESGVDLGENIFNMFLGIPNSRLTSIIRLQPCMKKNSSYSQAARTATEFKDRRLTRHLGSPSLSAPTSSITSSVKPPCRRGKGRTRGRKTTAKKAGLQVINKYKRKGTFMLPFSLGV